MRAIDLFAGAGGLSLGLTLAGIEVVAAVEHDPDACVTYRKHVGDHMIELSIERVDAASLPDCDLVAGGPPCQGFSLAGKRDSTDPRNTLWREFFRVVEAKRPAWVLIENVTGIVSTGEHLQLMEAFDAIGYDLTAHVLNAVDFGVPQKRVRVFFIGNRIGLPNPRPVPTHAQPPSHMMLGVASWVTAGDALANVAPVRRGDPDYVVTTRRDHGLVRLDAPSCVIKAGGNRESDGHMGGPCPPAIMDGDVMRRLTIRECAALQSFPVGFTFHGSRIAQHRQIGNAVAVEMARALGRSLLESHMEG